MMFAQMRIESPKNGRRRREAAISTPMLQMPPKKTMTIKKYRRKFTSTGKLPNRMIGTEDNTNYYSGQPLQKQTFPFTWGTGVNPFFL